MKADVAVVGGGVIGLCLALVLAEQKRRVVLLEQSMLVPENQAPMQRVYAINHASQQLLSRLAIWQRLPANVYAPYRYMQVWDGLSSGQVVFDCRHFAQPCLGWMVDELSIRLIAAELAAQHPQITCLEHQSLSGIEITEETATVVTSMGEWSVQLIAGCDGAGSWIRSQAGFTLNKRPYGHDAFICHFQTEQPHRKTAYQWFTPHGPLALLPLSDDHHVSMVYSADTSTIDLLENMAEDAFCNKISELSNGTLGRLEAPSTRHRFQLYEQQAVPYVKPRCVLLGDALHTFHPLAGLGANVGFSDVSTLAAILDNVSDAGRFHTLRRYERSRKAEVRAVIALVGKLKQWFSPESSMPQWLLGKGMRWLDRQSLVKRQLIKLAAGV